MTKTSAAAQTTTECACGDRGCRTMIANCKGCKTRGEFHVYMGDVHPIEYWECLNSKCGATYERQLMSHSEIIREARRGFVYAP
jgi:hypothetical protein